MFSLRPTLLLSLALAATVLASPLQSRIINVDVDMENGSCVAIWTTCVNQIKALDGPYTFFEDPLNFSDECTISAICMETTADQWLEDNYVLTPAGNRGKRPYLATSPRLSTEMYARIVNSASSKRDGELVARDAVATQQNFIDYFYKTAAKTGGPYPTDAKYVVDIWGVLAAWTGFCDTRAIPYNNLADWYQYSSTSKYDPRC